jgi:hypothetical protein
MPSLTSYLGIVNINANNVLYFNRTVDIWNTCGIANRDGTFIFKFFNNILGLNTRVSRFARDVNRSCTLCTKQ